ncbi:triphosphate tunnel metalloenzyme 3-like [Quercus robur]|uniref:triphosphate tunnel metalloenzyme 3-like n=1 Tax=Quercus robur TaxID=38942 RepID=UPI0021620580|nr:triphosphate tunnel metalloenzyme 3-like [Quercus robur]
MSQANPFNLKTHRQENHFFDSSSCELSSCRATLRLRFSDTYSLYVVTLKAKAVIVDVVSRIKEDEELLDPSIRRNCMAEPKKILSSATESRVLRRVKEEFGVLGFVGLEGFGNMRFDAVYEWKGLKLEVDESDFGFGTLYEIECESSDLEKVKKLIEEIGIFLGKNVAFSWTERRHVHLEPI